MSALIFAGIAGYMAAMLFIGWWSSRKIKNYADYLVAGRNLPFYLATATLFATWFGAGTCMGAAGTAYSEGILGVISDPFAASVSLVLAGLFYVKLLRRLKLLTVTDIFGIYYGKNSEIAASILMIPVYIGWLGSQIVALGYIVNLITGIDPLPGIILSTVIVLIYTYAGGMWAVTLTDFVQMIFLIAGLVIMFPIVLNHVGGLGNLIEVTPREFWHFYPHGGSYQNWVAYAGQWGLLGFGTIVGQDLIQRSLASKTEKVAGTSAISAGILYLLVGLIPVLLGLAGRIAVPEISDPELILSVLAKKFLPPVAFILFIGALLSAIMSSADSSLLAATSLITNNVFRRFFPDTADQTLLHWARISTLVIGLLSMAVALAVQQIYILMVNSWATLLVSILVPVTAALYWKKANKQAAWTSMLAGLFVWLGFIIYSGENFSDIPDTVFYQAAAYGGFASLLGYLAATYLRYSKIQDTTPVCKLPPEESL